MEKNIILVINPLYKFVSNLVRGEEFDGTCSCFCR
jgi:hypothetical protein